MYSAAGGGGTTCAQQGAQSSVQGYCSRFRASGLTRPLAAGLDDASPEEALFVHVPLGTSRPLPDWALIAQQQQQQKKKRKGVTLMLLYGDLRRNG